jgi:hypothetical protein
MAHSGEEICLTVGVEASLDALQERCIVSSACFPGHLHRLHGHQSVFKEMEQDTNAHSREADFLFLVVVTLVFVE